MGMAGSKTNHFFSPEEVNALIPRLEEHFQSFWSYRENAQGILEGLRAGAPETDKDFLPEEVAHDQMRKSQAHFLLEQAKKELDLILDMGCAVKDLEIGLVDFPHMLEF